MGVHHTPHSNLFGHYQSWGTQSCRFWPKGVPCHCLHLSIDDIQVDWINHFLTNTDIPNDVCPKYQQCWVSQDAPEVYLCPWGCHITVYYCGVLPWGHDTGLPHAFSHYPELGVWYPWVGQDGCEKWVHFTSIKSYPTHLVIFHGAYTSWDPNVPNYWAVTNWPSTTPSLILIPNYNVSMKPKQ